jgi:hypothetical protein
MGTAIVVCLLAAPSAWGLNSTPTQSVVTNGPVDAIAPTSGAVYIGGTFTQVGPRTGPGVGIKASTGDSEGFDQVAGGQNVHAVARDGSGGFYVGGSFTHVGGRARHNLAHILASGRVDPSFKPDPNGIVDALAVSGPTVYAGGEFTSIGGQVRSRIAALDSTTGVATGWDPVAQSHFSDPPVVYALRVSGSTVYAGGFFTKIGGQPRNFVAALDATTGAATSWDPDAGGTVRDLAVSGSTIYAAGEFGSIGGQSRSAVAALDETTGAATSWDPDPNPRGGVYALAVAGPTVYVAGNFGNIGGQPRSDIAALDATTGAATSWNPNAGHPPNPIGNWINALAVSGSRVYAGGSFGHIGGQPRNNIAALDATTGAVTSWDPNANDRVNALAVSGSTVYAGGDFTSTGGMARHNLAALNPTTGALKSWAPSANGPVYALAASGSALYVGGFFDHIGSKTRRGIAALNLTTGAITSWNPNAKTSIGESGIVNALALSSSTLYAGGYFSTIGGKARGSLAALNPTTGAATSWNPNSDGNVYTLAATESTVYVGGGFSHVGGKARSYIAALNPTTGAAKSWSPDALGNPPRDPAVRALRVSGSNVYAGGAFSSIGGKPRNYIAALNSSTGAATSWNPDAGQNPFDQEPIVYALRSSGSAVYAGGAFTSIGGQSRNYIAALDAASGDARSWDPSPSNTVAALAFAPDGSLWIGGQFTGFPTAPQSGIARFKP